MRQAIIHIGTTKTGTTSIQRVLGRNRAVLPSQGAFYPLSPGPLEHVKLHVMLARRRLDARGLPGAAEPRSGAVGLAEFPANFAEEMAKLPAPVERVIFSEERLSMLRAQDEIAALKEFLEPYFDSFKVVVYLRRQDSYLASRYSELLRIGVLDGPDNEIATPERLSHYDYQALIARWAAVFGEDAIIPRLYERGASKAFDSVDDFLSVCGISLHVPADDPARLRNASMSYAGQQLMLRMADLVQKETGETKLRGGVWFEISSAVSSAMPGQGWLPTRDEAALFMKRFEAGNEAVRKRYFPDRASLFADETSRFPLKPMTISEDDILDAACRSFLQSALRTMSKDRPAPRQMEGHADRAARRAKLREKGQGRKKRRDAAE
jgi:hypothetical protein